MPVLSKPSNWARITKSLTKRLHLKTVKRRLSDPFNRRVHCYTPSTEAEKSSKPTKKESKSKKKPYPPKKEKCSGKVSVGIQVSLPPRSLLQELSHAGSIDVMSYVRDFTGNSNSNNSVDWYRSPSRGILPSTSKPVAPKQGSFDSKSHAKSTGGHISSKKLISGTVLPSKIAPTSTKSPKTSSSTVARSSGPPPSYQHSGSSAAKNQRDVSTNTVSSSPHPAVSLSKHHHSTTSSLTTTSSSSTSSRTKNQHNASTSTTSSSLLKSHHSVSSYTPRAPSPIATVSSSKKSRHASSSQHNAPLSIATTSALSSTAATSSTKTNRHSSSSPTPSTSRQQNSPSSIATITALSSTSSSKKNHHTSSSTPSTSRQHNALSSIAATSAPSSIADTSSGKKNHHTSSNPTPSTSCQHNAPTSIADSYLRFSDHRISTAAATLSHYSAPLVSSSTMDRPPSPSLSRRHRSGSLSSPVTVPELLDSKREPQSIKTHTDYSIGRPHSPATTATMKRQRSNSYSEPTTGHSNPYLYMTDTSLPRTFVHGSGSPLPPMYQQPPVIKDYSSSSRLYHSGRDISKSDPSTQSSSHTATRQGRSHRSHSIGQKDSPRHHTNKPDIAESYYTGHRRSNSEAGQTSHRGRSPSPSPRHSARGENSGTSVQGFDGILSDPRKRRVERKKQENATIGSAIGDHSDVLKTRTSLGVDQHQDVREHVSSKLDSKESSILYSSSRGSLRRCNSTSSVADCLQWEKRMSSPDTTTIEDATKVLRSRGSFDDIRKIGLTGETRRNSPKHRVRALLKRILSNKKTTGQATQVYVSDIAIEQMFADGGLVGLSNIGNTCYMNSMLQCLSHTLEMTQIFMHPDFTSNKELTKAYCQLMQEIWHCETPLSITTNTYSSGDNYKHISPYKFKRAVSREYPQYSGIEQQDAQEFMRLLISRLHEEMKIEISRKYSPFQFKLDETGSHKEKADRSWLTYRLLEDSFISEVFMGQLKSTLQCSVCKGASVTFDPFWDICLPIPPPKKKKDGYSGRISKSVDLSNCFEEFTRVEVLDGDERPVCASCGKCQRSTKRMTIQRFPPVLVLMLKRFAGYQYRHKLETDVDIPQTLDVSAFASNDMNASGQPVKYELYATSNHSGGIYYGHYTAWVKHYATQEWYEFNDCSVTKLRSSHPITKSTIRSSFPYVLFYRKATTTAH